MAIQHVLKEEQAYGAFNGGEIIENKPVGFPQEGGAVQAFSNIFYWANAKANVDSTIGLHPHKGFEIISFVLEGSIKHFDTQMNAWKELHAGDVQIIRSGNGISHAEHMNKDARMFQIWVDPDLSKSLEKEASYSDYKEEEFPIQVIDGNEEKTLIGSGSPFKMEASGIVCKRVKVLAPLSIKVDAGNILSLYVMTEGLTSSEKNLAIDSFIQVEDDTIRIEGQGEIFYFLSPKQPAYTTYASQISR